MFSIWIYLVAALAIALAAFTVGQLAPGAGVSVVVFASTAWTAYVASRSRSRRAS